MSGEGPLISVIIPNHNGAATIGDCVRSVLDSGYGNFEVIVVDDGSADGSVEIIEGLPCNLVRFERNRGASAARNAGAAKAKGAVLFFIDGDCILKRGTLGLAASLYLRHRDAVVGGTYTPLAHDRGFFSDFQSVFINYSETKRAEPDYVATHAMLIGRDMFISSGGFDEDFMPIIEDVEFSHRLRRAGVRLIVDPELQVGHVFNFSLVGSLRNAFRKSRFWTMYSLRNRDLHKDSGTASHELKANTLCWALCAGLLGAWAVSGQAALGISALIVYIYNLNINRHLIRSFMQAGGPAFTLGAVAYYTLVYPVAVGAGGLAGAAGRMRNMPNVRGRCTPR